MHLPTLALTLFALLTSTTAASVCAPDDIRCLNANASKRTPTGKMPFPGDPEGGINPIVGYTLDDVKPFSHPIAPIMPRATPPGNEIEERYKIVPGYLPQISGNYHVISYPYYQPSMTTVFSTATPMPTVAEPIKEHQIEMPTCTTTVDVMYRGTMLDWKHPVRTVYKTHITITSSVDCKWCELEVKTLKVEFSHLPQLQVDVETVTEDRTTTTVPACKTSLI